MTGKVRALEKVPMPIAECFLKDRLILASAESNAEDTWAMLQIVCNELGDV